MEKLLTQQELRRICKYSDSTLERWRREGKGPRFIKIGRSVRYKENDVKIFFEEIGLSDQNVKQLNAAQENISNLKGEN